jgi:uncharacterized protein with NRDE domain
VCTLIALHRRIAGAPLVVAANRDEFHDRPAEGPAIRMTPEGRIIAPLDRRAGGTWLGIGPQGMFAAVTNVSAAAPDPGRRSRGHLVIEALAHASAGEAAEAVEKLPMGLYNPFNLFVADRDEAFAFTYEEKPRRIAVGGSTIIVGNGALDRPTPPKLEGLEAHVDALGPDEVLDGLAHLCRSHDAVGPRGPLDALCVHTPSYGTRSSTLLRLGEGGLDDSSSVLRFADGAPCENTYEDHTALLHRLATPESVAAGSIGEAS